MKLFLLILIFVQKDYILASPNIQNVADNYAVENFQLKLGDVLRWLYFGTLKLTLQGTISKYHSTTTIFPQTANSRLHTLQNEYE